MSDIFNFEAECNKVTGPSIYTEILEDWQRDLLKKFEAMTDEQFNAFIFSCRCGNGYVLVPGTAPILIQEMKRRDPKRALGVL